MKKTAIALLMLTSTAGVSAQEKGLFGQPPKPNTFSYNYVEANVIHMDHRDLNGLRFNGSFSFLANMSVIGSVTAATRSRTDHQAVTAGVAYHQELQGTLLKKTDVIVHGSVEYREFKYNPRVGRSYKDDDKGFIFGAGVRHQLITDLEVFGDFSVRTAGETDPFVTLGARYNVLPALQVNTSLEVSDNDIVAIGARYSF